MVHATAAAAAVRTCLLTLELLEPQLAPVHVHRHAIAAEELVADDAADLESEQHARRAQVQDDQWVIAIGDAVEVEIDTGQEERIAIPP